MVMLWRTKRSHINRRNSDSDVRNGDRPASPFVANKRWLAVNFRGPVDRVHSLHEITCRVTHRGQLNGGNRPCIPIWELDSDLNAIRERLNEWRSSYKNQGNGTVIKYKTARGEFLIGFLHFSSEVKQVSLFWETRRVSPGQSEIRVHSSAITLICITLYLCVDESPPPPPLIIHSSPLVKKSRFWI